MVLLGLYRPPNSRRSWFDTFQELILDLTSYGKIVLMGDLNCDLLKPESPLTKSLLTILESGNLKVQSDASLSPTRNTSSSATCIDFIAVDRCIELSRYVVSDFLISDHHPVEVEFEAAIHQHICPVYKRTFKKVDFNELGLKIADIGLQLDHVNDPLQLESQLQLWNINFITVLDEFAPVRDFPLSKKRPTWVDKDTRGLMRLRTLKSRKLRSGTPSFEDCMTVKNLKRCIKSRIRASIKNHGKLVMSSDDPKASWKFIKTAT